MKRPYVGIRRVTGGREVFRAVKPTEFTHPEYVCCIGPFRTARGAAFMCEHSGCANVNEAERKAVNEQGRRTELIAELKNMAIETNSMLTGDSVGYWRSLSTVELDREYIRLGNIVRAFRKGVVNG